MLVDVGCMLSHVLRVEKHGLIDLINLALKKVSLFEFCVEVCKSLLHSELLSLMTEVVLQRRDRWGFLHAAVICGTFRVMFTACHFRIGLLRGGH